MKKILLSTALAVVLVAALAVTAFAVGVSGPDTIATGDKIEITVTGSELGTSGNVSVSGLTVDSVSGSLSSPDAFLVVSDAPGGMSATYSCTVTAGAGETASFRVSNVLVSNGQDDTAGTDGSWSATVAAEVEPTQEPSDEPTTEPSTEPSTTPSTEPSADASASASASVSASPSAGASSSASVKPGAAGQTSSKPSAGSVKKDKLPKTGDTTMDLWTLAVIAAACAAVAVVAGKKIFSAK